MNNEKKIASRCWSVEGLWGDSSCVELATRVSCQNCPVYAKASRKLYGRKIPEDYLLSSKLASEKHERNNESGLSRLFVFKCADMFFAFPASAVSEISKHKMIHRIPHRLDAALEGIVNINGELVIVLAILRLLGLSSYALGDFKNSMIIVCKSGHERFAFRVDSILGMKFFDDAHAIAKTDGDSNYVEKSFSMGDDIVHLLDFELLSDAILKRKI